MSDSFVYTPGAGGENGAADRIGGLLFQRVKMTFGPDGTALDVSSADPLPVTVAGAATEATLASIDGKVPATATRPVDNEAPGLPVRPIGQEVWNCSFSNVGASIIAPEFTAPLVGTGVGFSQAGGALLVTTGTTTNAEFLTRSVRSWRGAMRLRFSTVLSQRIVNQNFAVLLADLLGEGLTYDIVSATVVDVTLTAHGFTAQNVGQFINLGGITGAAGVPGRYAIASIPDANTIRFTVAGWPGSGTGTLRLFGHSYVRNLYTGVTATNVAVDAQRRGWASGDTTATINTTAAPGHILQAELTGRDVFWSDALRASSTGPTFTSRASRYEGIPDDNLDLYVFLWSFNGPTAPASTTTWTVSYCAVEKFANTPVYLQGVRANGSINPLPVSGGVTVSGTVTSNIGTGALAAGANAIGDVGIQARANATGAASIHHFVAAATTNALNIKASAGRVLGWAFGNTTAVWQYVKLHNTAGAPTAGAGVVQTIAIPPGGVNVQNIPAGIGFATGIARTCVTGSADTDTTATTLGAVVGDIFFA
jgi:hypothetical protein